MAASHMNVKQWRGKMKVLTRKYHAFVKLIHKLNMNTTGGKRCRLYQILLTQLEVKIDRLYMEKYPCEYFIQIACY